MKKYVSAFVEIVSLEESDVIATSAPTPYTGTDLKDGDVYDYSKYFNQ